MAKFSVPWNVFVAAFLYYTMLTLLMIGVKDLATGFVLVSYLMPVALYGALLINRAVHALGALTVEIGQAPQALSR